MKYVSFRTFFMTCICTTLLAASTALGGGNPACPGEGDCCEANGTVGCNDEDCCNAICEADIFCCDSEWDAICAGAAQTMPDICDCAAGATQACCFPDGSCQDLSTGECEEAGGVPQGFGSLCDTTECPVAPDNDDCADRIDIDLGDTQFDTTGATTDGTPDPLCKSFGDSDVQSDIWYNYTADFTGDLTVSTCNQAAYDTKIAVYEGCDCPATNIIGCNDDGPGCTGFTSELTVSVTEGTCYKIRVGGFGGATGSGTLTLSEGGGGPVCGDGVCEGDEDAVNCPEDCEMGDDCPAQCEGDVNGDGQVDGADLGLLLGAFGDCPAEGSCCSDLNGDDQVDGADLGLLLGAFGPCPDMADGDECEDCIAVGEGTFSGDTTDNTGSTGDDTSCASGDEIDEWYCYTATCTDTVIVTTCSANTDFDTTLAVFDSCDGVELACNDDAGGDCEFSGLQSQVQFAAVEGETYFIRVSGFGGATGLYDLSISCGIPPQACCFEDGSCQDLDPADCLAMGGESQGLGTVCADTFCPEPLANDDCEDRIDIQLGDTQFSTEGATTDGTPDPLCKAFGDLDVQSDIWYNYTADFTGTLTVSTCNQADYDTKLAVYQGCGCPALDIIGCNDDGEGCTGFTSELSVDVTKGTCYKIRVGGFGGATGTGTLTLTQN